MPSPTTPKSTGTLPDPRPTGSDRPESVAASLTTSALALVRARPWLTSALALAALAIAIWGPSVVTHGRYYDDWAILAFFDDLPSHDPASVIESCLGGGPEGVPLTTRPGACIYHAGVDLATDRRVRGYHLLSLGFIWGSAFALYLLLTRCRLPWGAALVVGALWIVFPASDATRLWPTAVIAQAVVGLYLIAVLLGIAALRQTGWRAFVLHAASLLIYLALLFTYEIVIPLIAITAAFYWLAAPGRGATVRGGIDLAFAAASVVYRTVISPVDPEVGFTVERTPGELLSRGWDIAIAAWHTWQDLFVPGEAGAVVAVLATVIVSGAVVTRPQARRPIALSLAIAAGAAILVGAALVAYLPANDFYVPTVAGTFNRLNVAAAPAYCLGFGALVAALYFALTSLTGRLVGAASVAAVLTAVVAWQLDVGADSRASWKESWDAQTAAIHGLRLGLEGAPRDASVVSFGHPIWEWGFVPVFASTWDLRGMIDYHTDTDPPRAVPFLPNVGCGATGIDLDGVTWAPYSGDSRVVFVNAATQESRRIASRKACERAVQEWGPPPFFGQSVTGP